MKSRQNGSDSQQLMTMFPQRSQGANSRYLAPLPPPPQHPRAFGNAPASASVRSHQQMNRSTHRSIEQCRKSANADEAYKQLWLQACHLPFDNDLETSDIREGIECDDFRVWRNFSTDLGLDLSSVGSERGRRTAAIAECYPFRVPPPSRMGVSSLGDYLESSVVGRQKRSRQLAQMRRFESRTAAQLAGLSSVRRPSLDAVGRIKPPPGYKRYPPTRLSKPTAPVDELDPDSAEVITADMQPDLFGKLVKKRPPRLWKLSYKTAGG
uniref:Uncharacterized protein n=1 Tax=Macrostomum lignano TaxID=282301 RepID=A0A1I8GJN5_9PLAT